MLRRFLIALALCVPALSADDDMTKLKVEVKSLSDKPIDRASVIVTFIEGRSIAKLGKKIQTRWELRTNQEGIAKIPEIPQGKVRIQVVARGYQTFGQTFDVDQPDQTLTIKLNPPQPQYSAH
jgi:hypothetical protein